jgi:hypothetical protein
MTLIATQYRDADNFCAPVTCVIGRHRLYELGKSLRTRETGGGCAERPKCMKYSGRRAPRRPGGRSAGNSAPVARGRACGVFLFIAAVDLARDSAGR